MVQDGNHDSAATQDEIQFDLPGSHSAALPYRIVAAGRTQARAGTPLIRQRFNQHVLILPLQGCGLIRLDGREFNARPGTLAWLDTARRYEHGCARAEPAWHYLWLGVQGHGLDRLFSTCRVGAAPLTSVAGADWMAGAFVAAMGRLRNSSLVDAAENSATLAGLFAYLITARSSVSDHTGAGDVSMAKLAEQMRGQLAQVWRVGDLAERANLSPAQLHRRFRQAFGATPMDWLRRERIHAAKGFLVASDAKIAVVAADCGYQDAYHFSRDFSRLTGQSPSAFRNAGGR